TLFMKRLLLILTLFFCQLSLFAQELSGDWNGKLQLPQVNLPLTFHISQEASKATMDSPAQGAFDIPMDELRIEFPEITIKHAGIGMEFKGTYNAETKDIEGTFTQAGMQFPLTLTPETTT